MITYLAGTIHTPNVPHINFTEPVWLGIAIVAYGAYLIWREGLAVFHFIAALILGALAAGLWPKAAGKIAAWGAAGPAERSTVYAVILITVVGTIILGERRQRGNGEG